MGGVIGAAGGALGSIVGGIAGQQAGAGDRGEARNRQIDANTIIQNLQNAPISARPILLEQYRQAGILTPELEQAITTGPSKIEGITEDKGLRDAQLDALRSLTQRSKEGMTASDRAALNKVRQQVQTDLEAKRQQILQNAQMRGQAGGGSELAAQLMAAQGGANEQADASDRLMAMAQQNALQSASQMGQLGGQIRGQDFDINRARAAAADEMNRFNVQNQIGMQQRNVGSKNYAQQANLQNLQGIMNQNVAQQNAELQRQRQGELNDWQNAVKLGQIKAGQNVQLGNTLQQSGNQAAQGAYNQWSGLGQALGGVGQAAFGGSKPASSSNLGKDENYISGAGGDWIDALWTGGQVSNYKQGGQVPGHASIPGDHPMNDTVHAKLSPGEIVVPRSLAESKLGKELNKLINAHNSVKNKLNGQD